MSSLSALGLVGFEDFTKGTPWEGMWLDGEIRDGTAQGTFSSAYTAWLTHVFENNFVQKWLAEGADGTLTDYGAWQMSRTDLPTDVAPAVTNNGGITIHLNQNGGITGALPTISFGTTQLSQAVVDQIFGAKESFIWTSVLQSGKLQKTVTHERSYVDGFEAGSEGGAKSFAQILEDRFAPKASALTAATDEDGDLSTVSALKDVTDADNDLSSLTIAPPAELPAGVSYDPKTKSFSLDPKHDAFQSLAAGQPTTVTVEYRITDAVGYGVTNTISWTVMGVNDAASISGLKTGTVHEDVVGTELSTVGGKLTVADKDSGEAKFKAVDDADLTKDYGSFTFDTDGNWKFVVDNEKAQALGANQQVQQTLTVQSVDGTAPETITVTVVGKNDLASFGGDKGGTVHEDAVSPTEKSVATGKLTVSDLDKDEAAFKEVVSSSTEYGKFEFSLETGDWSFTLDNAKAQALGAGAVVEQKLVVNSVDGSQETITVNVVGKAEPAPTPPPAPKVPTEIVVDTFSSGTLSPNWTVHNSQPGPDTVGGTATVDSGQAVLVATSAISKSFALTTGDKFEFDFEFIAKFDTSNKGNKFDDIAYLEVTGPSGTTQTITLANALGDTKTHIQKDFSFEAAADGNYTFKIGVLNAGQETFDSILKVDNVSIWDV